MAFTPKSDGGTSPLIASAPFLMDMISINHEYGDAVAGSTALCHAYTKS